MSEEEKKAIEHLKNTSLDPLEYKADMNAIEIILNLIEKQQKEIEELKVINSMQKYRIEVIDERELISKDKIREKLEDLKAMEISQDIYTTDIEKMLEELLEE